MKYLVKILMIVSLLWGGSGMADTVPEVAIRGVESCDFGSRNVLWYSKPADVAWAELEARNGAKNGADAWMEYALPLGGGPLGMCLMGGVAEDVVQFNEKGLWSGSSSDNGKQYGSYLNFGWLTIRTTDAPTARNYIRWLDLDSAKAEVCFDAEQGDVHYRREYFVARASSVRGGVKDGSVIAIRYSASEKAKIHAKVMLKEGCVEGSGLVYDEHGGHFMGKLPSVSYGARFEVVTKGGTKRCTADGIEVVGADEMVVFLKAMTSETMDSQSLMALDGPMMMALNRAKRMGFDALYDELLWNYRRYYGTPDKIFALQGARNTMPTDRLVDAYGMAATEKGARLMLEQLYFHYGRYLAIASNDSSERVPTNLQGIWNHSCTPPWNSDYHTNINIQMNYWPMEVLGMSDLHLPLLRWIADGAESEGWQRNAREVGQQQGWTTFTENNIYGGVGAFAHDYVVANAWLCSHIWSHFLYTRSLEPVKGRRGGFEPMASACRFWMERLQYNAADDTYECPNEYSPEQGPVENGVAHAQQIVAELYANSLAADSMLTVNHREPLFTPKERALLELQYRKMDKGLSTELYDGAWGREVNGVKLGDPLLREWKYSPYSTGQNGHRHLSHLMGLYPFAQITPGSAYFDAAVNSLQMRGDASTGWSMGWKINLWARAQDGNHAHAILELALRHHAKSGGGVYYNLWDAHPPFQIDGNFGATAGVAEMLLQSQGNSIRLLPALPDEWQEGNSGMLKAQGNISVMMRWENGKLKEAVLLPMVLERDAASTPNFVVVHYPQIARCKFLSRGKKVKVEVIDENTVRMFFDRRELYLIRMK